MPTRAQGWSALAYQKVSGEKVQGDQAATSKYKTSCMKMPSLIHQSGVLQALVFQVARDKHGERYVDHLAQAWFGQDTANHRTLIEHAQRLELRPYMALTRDLSEVAQWFRRFAQIELKDVEEDDDNGAE